MNQDILQTNKTYWDTMAGEWFGVTSLPVYGVHFATEDELQLFGDVKGKKLLDIGCGSGSSMKYLADRGADDLWGLDLSTSQLEMAARYLRENGYSARFVNAPMEVDSPIPQNYFDIVYSIYAVGWTTDLDTTFRKIISYLKRDGVFIFSWKHPLHHCVQREEGRLLFGKSYFDEDWFNLSMDGITTKLCNRKMSTYINALARAGFAIEQMVEQTSSQILALSEAPDDKTRKAQMLPLSFVLKARKL